MVITEKSDLSAMVGTELGVSEWLRVTQHMIDAFATATGDRQWIHVDSERAAAGPFGTTIAHGFMVLSLLPQFSSQVYEFQGFGARLNYGLDRARFPHPLFVHRRIRDRVTLASATQRATGTLLAFTHEVEADGDSRPVCVAQTLTLLTPGATTGPSN
ncbi:MaoC family dehydratase [Leucobacter aridicollis]|nr:MaoC family dehydratase [Leucobacter aridicollis]